VPLRDPPSHANRFPACRRAVVHGRIGNIASEKTRNLRLEFEQHLQRALRDFGLIGRVGRQKFAALYHMIHRRRHMMLIGAAA
jgi:hypothetical protein